MKTNPAIIFLTLACLLIQGCATLSPSFKSPTVTIDSIALGNSTGLNQSFVIGLNVANPNSSALPVVGMEYSLSLNGFDLLSGVTNKIPTLEPYAATPVSIEANANTLSVLRLLNSLAQSPQNSLSYQLNARLELTGLRLPLNVKESGEIALTR